MLVVFPLVLLGLRQGILAPGWLIRCGHLPCVVRRSFSIGSLVTYVAMDAVKSQSLKRAKNSPRTRPEHIRRVRERRTPTNVSRRELPTRPCRRARVWSPKLLG